MWLPCAAGITGGFAGGERGVQQFVEKGQLDLVPPGKGADLDPERCSHLFPRSSDLPWVQALCRICCLANPALYLLAIDKRPFSATGYLV